MPSPPSSQQGPIVRVVAALIEREGRYLITQRREGAVLPLLWEFPGGKVEPGENDETALRRELFHRLGVDATIGASLAETEHPYERYTVQMALYAATLPPGDVRPLNVRDVRWVGCNELPQYRFPEADQRTMDLLLGSDALRH